jgi:O-antigen/teichoic acid export membrane protein
MTATPRPGSTQPAGDEGMEPPLRGSMTRQAARGVSWSFVGAAGQFLLQLVSIVVLSRLLSVSDYGTAVAATVVLGLAAMLGQQSIAPALVQARTLDRADIGTAFAIAWPWPVSSS